MYRFVNLDLWSIWISTIGLLVPHIVVHLVHRLNLCRFIFILTHSCTHALLVEVHVSIYSSWRQWIKSWVVRFREQNVTCVLRNVSAGGGWQRLVFSSWLKVAYLWFEVLVFLLVFLLIVLEFTKYFGKIIELFIEDFFFFFNHFKFRGICTKSKLMLWNTLIIIIMSLNGVDIRRSIYHGNQIAVSIVVVSK